MFQWLFGLRRKPVVVQGTRRLAEGHAKQVDVGGVFVIFCRVDGVLHALDSACPHEGGRIVGGPLVDGRYATCPLHHYKFDPRTGAAVDVACAKARVYKVRERDGEAEVWL
jgi:3-phenylpropionate/trans-cinnamate dioxygenase ferredoxin subunit